MKNGVVVEDKFLEEILKKKCFRITKLNNKMSYEKNAFYYFRFIYNQKDVDASQKNNFIHAGDIIVFKKVKIKNRKPKIENEIELSNVITKSDLHSFNELISVLSKEGRFYADPILRKFSKIIYRRWIENSLFNNYSTHYVIARYKNKIVGLGTMKYNRVDLIGVNPSHQGKGIGSKILNELLETNSSEDIILGTSIRNVQAIKFYLKNGFIPQYVESIYHKHT